MSESQGPGPSWSACWPSGDSLTGGKHTVDDAEDAVIGIQTPLLTLHLAGKGHPHASLLVAGYRRRVGRVGARSHPTPQNGVAQARVSGAHSSQATV